MKFTGYEYREARRTYTDEVVDEEAEKRWDSYAKMVELLRRVGRTRSPDQLRRDRPSE
jgi:hypothetical protein